MLYNYEKAVLSSQIMTENYETAHYARVITS